MTTTVFYLDPLAQRINARVVDQREKDGASWLLLDQTLFYPGGGGQLPDKGSINGQALLDIRGKGGEIWHKISSRSETSLKDAVVSLELDWDYRHYQMQQHTGQHLLSAVFQRFGYSTLSVHLGEQHTLIELDGTLPENALLRQVESVAQQYIAKAVPVKTYFVPKEEAERLGLRRPAKSLETLRIVEIEGIDKVACSGLHVRNTAEIGAIKIRGVERIRGHIRIEAVIGRRAFEYFDALQQVSDLLKGKLHTDLSQFGNRIDQMQEEIGYLKKLAKFYSTYFVKYESAQLAQSVEDVVIVHRMEHGEQRDAAEIARYLSKHFGKVALLQFDRRFYLASPDVQVLDTIKFLRENAETLEIKGGGPRDFCQGIMHKNNLEQIAEAIKPYIQKK